MGRFFASRALQGLFSLWALTVLVFLIVRLTGDPLQVILPEEATQEMYEQTAARLGLDRPLPVQYARYLGDLLSGDLGRSHRTATPVSTLIVERIPATLQLSLTAIALMLVASIPAGVYAAHRRGGKFDLLVRAGAALGQAMPQFWLGLLLILLFGVRLGWLPAGGRSSFASVILPAVTLAFAVSAGMVRLMRSSQMEVLESDYIKFARGKGMHERNILWKHGFRNASLPVMTFGGLMSARLLTGSIVTETVFAWPGIGRLAYDAISTRDFPVVQGVILTMSVVYILVNLTVDVAYMYLNPRLRGS